jgi:hypothetical protein
VSHGLQSAVQKNLQLTPSGLYWHSLGFAIFCACHFGEVAEWLKGGFANLKTPIFQHSAFFITSPQLLARSPFTLDA